MKERPSFPARLPGSASVKKAKPATPANQPQGLGMDSSAVRQRMLQKLAGQGLRDPLVLQAMGAVERHRFVDSALVNHAGELALHFGLRAYDSVQLATACKAREVAGDGLRFCCFDKQLINASRVLGLDALAP